MYGRRKKLSKPKTQIQSEEKREIIFRIIKNRIIRDIRTLFEQQEQKDYHKPKKVSNFLNNNYIEYESNGDKNRNFLLDKHLNKIKLQLRDIIIDLQNYDRWKI